MDNYNRILGAMLGAAAGDAMGALTETKSAEMILERFGAYVDDLLPGPDDCFVRGMPAGAVTDDFSLAYFTAKALSACGGNVTPEVAKEALLEWASHPEFFRYAGPSTKECILMLQGERIVSPMHYLACENNRATNGSAMKIFPVGLINPGDLDKTIDDAVTVCMPSHDNEASISGAAAVACAVSAAMVGAEVDVVIDAAFYGAKKGFDKSRERGARRLSVPSTVKRMELALDIAGRGLGFEETMLELAQVVGAGIAIYEAVPSAFGVLKYTEGDALSGIKMAVNMGNDTDSVATVVGAIAGAMQGSAAFPKKWLPMIESANKLDITGMSKRILEAYYR